jgi:hypothetical protein
MVAALAALGYLRLGHWFQGGDLTVAGKRMPVRTVYNAQTNRYEELLVSEFDLLSRQGRIEEADAYSPYNGHDHKVYRLI